MSHAVNRVVPGLSGFRLQDKHGIETGQYNTPEEAEQSSQFQSIMSGRPWEHLAPERPPFLHEINYGTTKLPRGAQMPGLSQYQSAGLSSDPRDAMDTRNPALARNRMSDQDSAGLDAMLRNLDSGAAAPGTLGQNQQAMPQPAAQGNNPWLQWLMQYMQTKGQQPTQGLQ